MAVKSSSIVIVVFESKPFWGPELHRQFIHADVSIQECRSLEDVHPAVAGFETALLVLDIDSSPERCLNWLISNGNANFPRSPIIACGSDANADLEWRFREAGVTAFLPDVIPGDDFANLCRRQLGIHRRSKSRAEN